MSPAGEGEGRGEGAGAGGAVAVGVTLCGRLRQGSWAVPRGHLEAFEAVEGVRPMMKWVQPKFLRMIMCWMASRGPDRSME